MWEDRNPHSHGVGVQLAQHPTFKTEEGVKYEEDRRSTTQETLKHVPGKERY